MPKTKRQSFIITLFSLLAKLVGVSINLVAIIIYFPIYISLKICESVLLFINEEIHQLLYWCTIPIRYIFSSISFPSMMTYFLLLEYIIYRYSKGESLWKTCVSVVLSLLANIYLMIKFFKIFKIKWKILCNSFWRMQFEIIGFIVSIPVVFSIIR